MYQKKTKYHFPAYRHSQIISSRHSTRTYLPMKMGQCTETSAYKIQKPGNHTKQSTQHSGHGESLKSRIPFLAALYRVIHKSLRDCRPLRYSSRDGHAEGEHVNRGRDTPSFCPASAVPGSRDLLTSEGAPDKRFSHTLDSLGRWPRPGLFVSQRTGSHSAGISCTTHELFCP